MDVMEALLFAATQEALDTLGEPTSVAFLWHLEHEKMPFSKKAMDIVQIESKLKQFFGTASPVIIEMIYARFMMRAATAGYFSKDTIGSLDKLPLSSKTATNLRLVARHQKISGKAV